MRTIAIVGTVLLITSFSILSLHLINSGGDEPAEAPVSVELPDDEIEIHCEIIKPA
jgi:hypothetical protein